VHTQLFLKCLIPISAQLDFTADEKDNCEVIFGTAFDNITAFAAGRPQNVAA
jgi:hypothetical protein